MACVPDSPADTPFAADAVADRVRVVVEVWPAGAAEGWVDGILDVLDRRGVEATVIVPLDYRDADVLARVRSSPHDLGVDLPEALVPRDPNTRPRVLARAVRELEAAGEPVKTVVSSVGSRTIEALLGTVGFRSIVDRDGLADATPRLAGVFEGQQRIDVVLPPGPYDAGELACAPFSPADADRATVALHRANATAGVPVVRVQLVGEGGAETDASVLDRWLVTVVGPSGAAVGTAERARLAVLAGFHKPGGPAPPPIDAGGRGVDRATLTTAAEALREGGVLPRTLPGELTPAEAFVGFLGAVHAPSAPSVRLPPIAGPAQSAASTLPGPVEVDAEALRRLAAALVADLPAEVPGAMRVGSRLLTAPELLLALASAVRGDQPIVTRPILDPDPNARGLGWGASAPP